MLDTAKQAQAQDPLYRLKKNLTNFVGLEIFRGKNVLELKFFILKFTFTLGRNLKKI